MTTISTKIPDTLFRQAKSIAEREDMTLDEFIALALASQISSWNVGKTFEERARKGDWKKAREVLSKVPDVEAEDYDKL
jgi:predicted nucleic acid-binding protein